MSSNPKIKLRYPAKNEPVAPVVCPTRKERFTTERGARCASSHITQGTWRIEIEQCPECHGGWHIELTAT